MENNYEELKETFELNEDALKTIGKAQKRLKYQMHKQFRVKYRKYFRLADILVILAILLNFGAAFSTSLIVERAADVVRTELGYPDFTTEYQEANPVVAKAGGLETSKEANIAWGIFAFISYGWIIIITWYLYLRLNTSSWRGLTLLLAMPLGLFIILGTDFFHDIGFVIGKLLWEQGFLF